MAKQIVYDAFGIDVEPGFVQQPNPADPTELMQVPTMTLTVHDPTADEYHVFRMAEHVWEQLHSKGKGIVLAGANDVPPEPAPAA